MLLHSLETVVMLGYITMTLFIKIIMVCLSSLQANGAPHSTIKMTLNGFLIHLVWLAMC